MRRVQHLVMWAADTDRLVDDLLAVEVCLRPVTAAIAQSEGIIWATHDLDRESVCFSLMVEGWARGSEDGLAAARLRLAHVFVAVSPTRVCLRLPDRRAGSCSHPCGFDWTSSP